MASRAFFNREYLSFVKRVQTYMQKALHEAKVHSSWINPDPDYDAAVREFVGRILDEKLSAAFLTEFRVWCAGSTSMVFSILSF